MFMDVFIYYIRAESRELGLKGGGMGLDCIVMYLLFFFEIINSGYPRPTDRRLLLQLTQKLDQSL